MSLYDGFLDETFPAVDIAGIHFNVSRILRELDATAYNCGEQDYHDSLVTDFFESSREFSRDDVLTDGCTVRDAEAWAFSMLENDKMIEFSDLELLDNES